MENSTDARPLAVGIVDAGRIIGVSKHTIRSWYYRGLLHCVKAGARLLVPYAELERISREGLQR